MKTSLKNATEQTDDVTEVDETALALMDEDTGSNLPAPMAFGEVDGEVDASDIVLPKVNLVQKIGELSDSFDPGDLLLSKETVIYSAKDAKAPLSVTVLSIKKLYEEWLDYDANGPMPQRFSTDKELTEAGLWTDWRNNERPPARAVAELLLLIKKPADLESLGFYQTVAGEDYAMAMWTLRGNGYTHGAKPIFSAKQIQLRKTGLLSGEWQLSTSSKQSNGNTVYIPVLRLVNRHSEEFIAELKAACGQA